MEAILDAGKDRTILLNPPFYNNTKDEKNQLTTTMWVDKILQWIARQTKVQAWILLPVWEEFACSANIFNVVNRKVIQMLRPYAKKVLTFANAKCFQTNTFGVTTEMGTAFANKIACILVTEKRWTLEPATREDDYSLHDTNLEDISSTVTRKNVYPHGNDAKLLSLQVHAY